MAFYCTNHVGDASAVTFNNAGDRLVVKFVSAGTAGEYKIVPTNVEGKVIIGVTGTGNSSVVTYYADETDAQNSIFLLKAETGTNGYKHAFDIYPKGGNSGWNMYEGVSSGTYKQVKLHNNGDQGCMWNLIPANQAAMEAMKEDVLGYVQNKTNVANVTDVIGGFSAADTEGLDGIAAGINATAQSTLAAITDYSYDNACTVLGYEPNLTEFANALNSNNNNNKLYLPTGYYYFKSLNTDNRPPYLFNDYFREANTQHHTLQANTPGTTNNYIWHVTNKNDGTIAIVNGEGTPVVQGVQSAGPTGAIKESSVLTFNTFNYEYFSNLGGIHFTENLNAGKASPYVLTDDTRFLTTWNGGPQHADNRWTFEEVSLEGKTVYTVSISGFPTDAKPYITCGDENAFDGGFLLKESTIDATAVSPSDIENYNVTVTVEGSVIKVVYVGKWNALLSQTIETAETTLADASTETGIGYPTTDAKNNLDAQINVAKEIAEATEADVTDLQTAIDNYKTKVQLPADGSYIRIKNYNRDLGRSDYNPNSPSSHDGEGGYMTATSRHNENYVGIQYVTLDDAAAVWKMEAVDVAAAQFKLYNLNAKKYLGKTNGNNNSNYIQLTENADEAGVYTLTSTQTYPQFTLNCNVEGTAYKQLHASGYGLMNWGSGLNANGPSAWIITDAEELTVNLHKAGETDTESYASVYLPFNVTLPADVTANKGSLNAEKTELTLTSVAAVPAENGVILVSQTAAENVTLNITEEDVTDEMSGNDLKGTLTKKNFEDGATYYFLGKNDNNQAGMYRPAESLTQIPGNRAYIQDNEISSVQGLLFNFSGTTAIDHTVLAEQAKGNCYDLSGRRVSNPQKGVYIIGNRKVILK